MRKIKTLISLMLLLVVASACKKANLNDKVASTIKTGGRVYYVSDPAGVDNNKGVSQALPFKTIAKALQYVQPGDSIYLMTGTFNVTSAINITTSGTAGKFITIKALPGNKPKLYASGNNYNAIVINASYIKLEGIELQGDNANLNEAGATTAYNAAAAATPVLNGTYNTQGIIIGGSGANSLKPNHVEVRNCTVHDFPGGGIAAITADYVTIEGNTVYNNCWYSIYAPSGISILTPYDSDANTSAYKNIVRNNVCFNNKTIIPWINTKALSDGNGIIIDVNLYPYDQTSGLAYNGKTLVENNISVNNGGSGIHAYKAAHVDIINNTAYKNGQVVGYANIYAQDATNIRVMNNIMYAKTGGDCNGNTRNINVTYDYNVYFNGNVAVSGTHDVIADPLFINASSDLTTANFQLKPGSKAANAGNASVFSAKDLLGISRPKGAAPDCGAYESF